MTHAGHPGGGVDTDPHGPDRARTPRLHHLDNLRAAAVLAVLVLHTSICYMLGAPQWWYVVDPDQSIAFTVIVLVVDVPVMSAMFLVAGYFALPSLRRRGTRGFVREKVIRLGAPWVFGVLVLAPAVTYLSYVSRGIPLAFADFWATQFWGPRYQQSVYWFLGVLLSLFLVLPVAVRLRPGLLQRPATGSGRPWLAVGVVALVGVCAAAASAPFVGLDDWRPVGWVFLVQPARVALYPAFFALGVHAERHGWLTGDGWHPGVRLWLPAAAVTGVAYLAFRATGYTPALGARIGGAALFVAFCVSAVLAAAAGFGRWLDRSTPVWRTLSDNSFGVYYVHPLVLYPAAWLLLGVAVPGVLKAVLALAITVVVSLVLSAGVLRRAPGLRRVF